MQIQSSFYLLLLILNKQGSLLQHVDKFFGVLQTVVSMFTFFQNRKNDFECILCIVWIP